MTVQTWLTRIEAAEYLGASPRTMGTWVTKGRGPRYRRIGRKVMYRLADLEEWAARQEHDPEAGDK